MGHIFKRKFVKESRKTGNIKSSSTIKSQKLLRKLEKRNGEEKDKEK